MSVALEVSGLAKTYGGGRTLFGRRQPGVAAVRGVTLAVAAGETLGIVGESGCGKSTLARMIAGLEAPSAGEIAIEGRALGARAGRDPAAFGRVVQYVFQDPIASLNPRRTVGEIVEAPLRHLHRLGRAARRARVAEAIEAVNLRPEFLGRYPHEFSGGQAQRIGIARALAARPRILLLDEPVSALDVSVQAQVLNLLSDLRRRFGLTYVFISHDLAVVEAIADRVAVMYAGAIVELGPAEAVFATPRHPYTALLAASVPSAGAAPPRLGGEGGAAGAGCPFAPRCPRADARCRAEVPPLAAAGAGSVACHHPLPAGDGRPDSLAR